MSEKLHQEIDDLDEYVDLGLVQNELLPDDYLICECNCVSALDIRNTFAETKTIDFDVLKQKLLLGTGCQSCLKNCNDWKKKIFKE